MKRKKQNVKFQYNLYKLKFKTKKQNMKKVFFAIAAIVATMTITSCGNGATSQTETTDSTAVQTDSTVATTDSTTVQVDSTTTVK